MAGVGGKHNIRVNGIRPGQIMTPGATRGTINDADGGHHVFESMFDLAQIVKGPGYPEDVVDMSCRAVIRSKYQSDGRPL